MSVHQDISALKASEDKLQQSEERLQQVIASTNDGVWDWNVETGEGYLSPRWKEIFGYLDEELENRASTFFDMIHPDDRNAVAEAMKRIKGGSSNAINHAGLAGGARFAWQEGYGAFSVSSSKVPDVVRYIANQREHHRTQTFEEEFVEFLERHGIDYRPEYLWD